ncbi:hypothetical protein [Paenibacillus sp. PL2-23]|uniref:hypothetical protein n=1 Tax=Paenibacillus sp. PL2-23 TaxID=2100729 RepID=UPI0030FAEE02
MFNRSKRPGKWDVWAIILVALFVIGLIVGLMDNLISFLLPIVILGGIFLLYKYPPSFLGGKRRGPSYVKHSASASAAPKQKPKGNRPKSRNVPFRVIEGGKDDDDTPKYH